MNHPINDAWNGLLSADYLERLDDTDFLRKCRAGRLNRDEAENFLVQQHHYAKHFVRYLCALLANLSQEEDGSALIGNLFEEMGYGDVGAEPHSEVYRNMLRTLDLDPNASQPYPETEALVTTMLRLCSDKRPMVGLGALCLGAEAIVPHVYSQIVQGLRAAGYADSHLRFFALHIEGDDAHALSMKAIIDRELRRDPDSMRSLLDGMRECIEKRTTFFDAIVWRSKRGAAEQGVSCAV